MAQGTQVAKLIAAFECAKHASFVNLLDPILRTITASQVVNKALSTSLFVPTLLDRLNHPNPQVCRGQPLRAPLKVCRLYYGFTLFLLALVRFTGNIEFYFRTQSKRVVKPSCKSAHCKRLVKNIIIFACQQKSKAKAYWRSHNRSCVVHCSINRKQRSCWRRCERFAPALRISTTTQRTSTTHQPTNQLTLFHVTQVRVNLLKILTSLYEYHPNPKKMIAEHQLFPVVKRLTEDKTVLVRNLASKLLVAFNANTVVQVCERECVAVYDFFLCYQ